LLEVIVATQLASLHVDWVPLAFIPLQKFSVLAAE